MHSLPVMNLTNALDKLERGWVFTDTQHGYSLRKFNTSLREWVDASVPIKTARALLRRGLTAARQPRTYEIHGTVAR